MTSGFPRCFIGEEGRGGAAPVSRGKGIGGRVPTGFARVSGQVVLAALLLALGTAQAAGQAKLPDGPEAPAPARHVGEGDPGAGVALARGSAGLPALLLGREAAAPAPSWQPLETRVTPRGAFLRSLVVPGWGHMEADAPTRAAFYVATQGGSWWMLGRSLIRRGAARRTRDAVHALVVEELRAGGMANPDSIRLAAENDPRVERWDELVDIRGEQVEDWIALGVFLALLGATDALVAAHMADYPEPLGIVVGPVPGASGGWRLGVSLPAGWLRVSRWEN